MHDNGHACIKVEIDCHLISMALLVQDLIRESGKEEKKKKEFARMTAKHS